MPPNNPSPQQEEEAAALPVDGSGSPTAAKDGTAAAAASSPTSPGRQERRHPPAIAWTRRFDDVPDPAKFRPAMPGFLESLSLIPLAMRMGAYVSKERREGRDPIFDLNGLALQPPNPGPYSGVPLGGIGGGCIGRGFRGEFRRWNLAPGKYRHATVMADQFSVRVKRAGKVFTRVLSVEDGRASEALKGWAWGMPPAAATCHALFPRAWTVYEEAVPLVKLTCRQVSPVIPHDYVDSSLPTAVFEWTVENLGPAPAEVSLMFTFQNGTGSPQDKAGGHYNRPFVVLDPAAASAESGNGSGGGAPICVGVQMHHRQRGSACHSAARGPVASPTKAAAPASAGAAAATGSGGVETMRMQRGGEGTSSVSATTSSSSSSLGALASLCACGEACKEVAAEAVAAATASAGGAAACGNCGLAVPLPLMPASSSSPRDPAAAADGDGDHDHRHPHPLTFAIAAPPSPGVDVSVWHQFQTSVHGSDPSGAAALWAQFTEEGRLRDPAFASADEAARPWWEQEEKEMAARRGGAKHHAAAAAAAGRQKPYVLERRRGAAKPSQAKQAIGAAVCQKVEVAGYGRATLSFALAWDMPYAVFGKGLALPRRYTRFFPGSLRGHTASAAAAAAAGGKAPAPAAVPARSGSVVAGLLAAHALRRYPAWEAAIEAWQRPVLEDAGLPTFYKHMLFNELYYLTDGGTVWTESVGGESAEAALLLSPPLPQGDAQQENEAFQACHGDQRAVGQFLYLEGHEYLMYNTYDVHFYASFALAMLWPMLELSVQLDVAAAVMAEDPRTRRLIADAALRPRKVAGSVPHDLGCPSGEPWREVNAYNLQDVNRWKDLGPKLVLQAHRDYVATGSRPFLEKLWPVLVHVMRAAQAFDRDGDGLVENENFPDQTYDIWAVQGPSAYTGGLWVAALVAMEAMARAVGDARQTAHFAELAGRARGAYVGRLWNGKYFDYDASASFHQDSIMADQMAGQWYARACGLPPVVDAAKARSSLGTVYAFNVKRFADGRSGAVNGMRPDGTVDGTCMQSQEVWTGTTYSVAAAMLQEARWAEEAAARQGPQGRALHLKEGAIFLRHAAFETARGLYEAGWRRLGYWFATPEAWDAKGHYRSLGYMRPLAIWSMQWALTRMEVGDRPVDPPPAAGDGDGADGGAGNEGK